MVLKSDRYNETGSLSVFFRARKNHTAPLDGLGAVLMDLKLASFNTKGRLKYRCKRFAAASWNIISDLVGTLESSSVF